MSNYTKFHGEQEIQKKTPFQKLYRFFYLIGAVCFFLIAKSVCDESIREYIYFVNEISESFLFVLSSMFCLAFVILTCIED